MTAQLTRETDSHGRTVRIELDDLVIKFRLMGGRNWWLLYDKVSGNELSRHATQRRAIDAAEGLLRGRA